VDEPYRRGLAEVLEFEVDLGGSHGRTRYRLDGDELRAESIGKSSPPRRIISGIEAADLHKAKKPSRGARTLPVKKWPISSYRECRWRACLKGSARRGPYPATRAAATSSSSTQVISTSATH
jgi:hypothetical protein